MMRRRGAGGVMVGCVRASALCLAGFLVADGHYVRKISRAVVARSYSLIRPQRDRQPAVPTKQSSS
ncbi:exported hypothetical protein [Parafrankia sp. Ea1.12]|nr:exported hypothetical protein [Parafrankia sp. Ea1.12]